MIRVVGILLLVITQGYGQLLKPIQFREESFDFGTVKEAGGPVTHEFMFTNNSDRPVKILSANASCGCTTPSWSKDPVAPGKTGYIQARFDPKGRPGFFTKSVTVTTDYEATPIILQIKGQVNAGGSVEPTGFTVANGNWKLKNGTFNMGKVYRRDELTTRDFIFINSGTKPITFTGKTVGPAYIKADVQPATVAPGAQGNIKVSYNGKLRDQYGYQSDNIELHTNDELSPVKSFTVLATLEDYFPQLTKEELAKAPQMKIASGNVDFGRFSQNNTVIREVAVTNTGKKELSIRSLQGNCTCVKAEAEKKVLKSGETAMVKISFLPQDRKGTLQKALTVYSNDPQNPVQRITLTGYAE